ncbi:MAG: NYN domain-containing protein [Rhizobiaceae bacterium]|nr:NYN domain-containing protein [Rhizobiaceae bacterium]
MSDLVYVDNSNLFIEGMRVKAVEKGMARNIFDAMNNKIVGPSYKIDFGRLHHFIAGDDPASIKRCMLFGSRPPPNDSLWKVAERAGFEVIVEDRNIKNKEKKVDTGLVAYMMRDAYKIADPGSDTITLVAGDADFVPSIELLKGDGYRVEVAFWDHAAKELRDCASKFVSLNPILNHLAL